jgi:hypothetical protein
MIFNNAEVAVQCPWAPPFPSRANVLRLQLWLTASSM